MRTLILMRHAKSDWGDETLSDHDRPLNARGRRAAAEMGLTLAARELLPDRVLSSTSRRTRETLEFLSQTAGWRAAAVFLPELYLAEPDQLLASVREHGGEAATLLVLAHNPGIEALASTTAGDHLSFPTAALAAFEVGEGVWRDLPADPELPLRGFHRPASRDG